MRDSKCIQIFLSAALTAALTFGALPALAAGNYTVPGQSASEEQPKQPEAPEQTAEPETPSPTQAPVTEEKPNYSVPGQTASPKPTEPTMPAEPTPPTEPTAPTASTEPEPSTSPEEVADQAYMEQMVMAFMDGETVLNPLHAEVRLQAVLVRLPDKRIGEAQWYVNGEARSDYYSGAFPIYNGKTTALNLSVPFTPETEDGRIEVALEVRLGGVTRRIAKTVRVENYSAEWYREQEVARVYEMIQPVDIEATVRYRTNVYADASLRSVIGTLDKGAQVIYTDHSGTYAASIWLKDEQKLCWVPYDSLTISGKDYTVYEDFSDEDKETFVNAKGYTSRSEYLVWVNLERQKVNVFYGTAGNWDLIRVSTCASGANTTPTPAGQYTYCAYGDGWYHPTYYVKPVLYLDVNRGIALHSILFSPDGRVQDGTQGTPASHGCVRMPAAEVRWLADTLPIGTRVVVF